MAGIKLLIMENASEAFREIVMESISGIPHEHIDEHDFEQLETLKGNKFIIAYEIDDLGMNDNLYALIRRLKVIGPDALKGAVGTMIVKSDTLMYTKKLPSGTMFLLNAMGAEFIGHSLVEAVVDYDNFSTWQISLAMPKEAIFASRCRDICKRLYEYEKPRISDPEILVLHAGSRKTSNTLMLWDMIKTHISVGRIKEFHVEDGTITDCNACPFKTCMHYSQEKRCFYGGVVTEELLPAIERADVIVWICPNYNDAMSAKLMAVVNRLTVLYRRISFHEKRIYGVVVSGNSGGDSVSTQLIRALNINKGFILPPMFSIIENANQPRSILAIEDIEEKAKAFAATINEELS